MNIKVQIRLLMAVLFVTACTGKKSDPTNDANSDIAIGEFGSLTGSEATFGISSNNGLKMAIEEQNAKGGIDGRKIKLITYDNQGRSEEAASVVKRLITQDKVVGVIGDVASPRTLFAAPIAQQYKVPLITPSSTDPKITRVGDQIFRVCFTNPFQGMVMAKFAAQNLKLKRVAILKDMKMDYSLGLAEAFEKSFRELGGEIVATESYQNDDTDFKAQLTQIRGKNPDGIFVPGYYTAVGLIARQVRQLGMKAILLGGDGWESPKLAEIGKEAVVGSFFSTHFTAENPDPFIVDFVKRYKAKYGDIPNGLAAAGYDAGLAMISALQKAKPLTPESLRAQIASIKDLKGVTGTITINDKRDAVKSAAVVQVTAEGMRFVTTVNP